MNGKALLASLMSSIGLSAAATAQAGAVASGKPDLSAEDQTAGTASLEALVEAAHNEGMNAGRKAERERFGAVLTSDEAVGRTGLAITLLSTTDNTPEQIAGALKASPSVAETVSSHPDAGAAPKPQQAATDPLRSDPIAEDTSLVDTGQAQEPKGDEQDEAVTASLWKGALATVSGNGIAGDGPWGFLNKDQRAN